MNTKDKWQTVVTIYDEHRAAVWGKIFPGARMPVMSIIPLRADLPGHPGASVYFLDLAAITDGQRDQLIQALADLFNEDPEQVRRDVAAMGVPILTEDTSLESTDQGQVLVLFDDVHEPMDVRQYDPGADLEKEINELLEMGKGTAVTVEPARKQKSSEQGEGAP
jgi:hypothetical protein